MLTCVPWICSRKAEAGPGVGAAVPCLALHGAAMAGAGAGAPLAPPQLDDFILTERLGSGTYATVFKAYRKVGRAGPGGKRG